VNGRMCGCVDNNENDMTNGIILDGALLCPPKCPTNSPLM